MDRRRPAAARLEVTSDWPLQPAVILLGSDDRQDDPLEEDRLAPVSRAPSPKQVRATTSRRAVRRSASAWMSSERCPAGLGIRADSLRQNLGSGVDGRDRGPQLVREVPTKASRTASAREPPTSRRRMMCSRPGAGLVAHAVVAISIRRVDGNRRRRVADAPGPRAPPGPLRRVLDPRASASSVSSVRGIGMARAVVVGDPAPKSITTGPSPSHR
jgi:hypothetical protein